MAKPKNIPHRANRITSYERLEQFVDKFSENHYTFLLIVGPPGIGKSQIVKRRLDSRAVVIENHATALGLYCRLFENLDRPLLIDDVDSRSLLALCLSVSRLNWLQISNDKSSASIQRFLSRCMNDDAASLCQKTL